MDFSIITPSINHPTNVLSDVLYGDDFAFVTPIHQQYESHHFEVYVTRRKIDSKPQYHDTSR